jgi:Ca2+-binding RTX toxin-like protein
VFHTSTGCATVIGGTFEFSNLPGSSYATYHALSGQETLQGVNGPTEFIGGNAKSSVLMEGGLSNDTFVGGAGSDTMVGGGGTTHNLFEFLKADAGGTHLITNFVSGQDHLYLEGYSLKYLENHGDISTSTTNNVTTTTIALGDGTTVKLQGVSGLSSSDITTHKPGH